MIAAGRWNSEVNVHFHVDKGVCRMGRRSNLSSLSPGLKTQPLIDEVFHLSVWYHHRNDKRRRKCSRANEVLSLQRILPNEQKRKTKIHFGQQLLRTTGSWCTECPTFHQKWAKVSYSLCTLELVGFIYLYPHTHTHTQLVSVSVPNLNTRCHVFTGSF